MKHLAIMLSSALTMANLSLAQTLSPQQVLTGAIGLEAGDYSFTSFDRSKLLEILSERQEQDRNYVIQAVNEIEASFADFINTELTGEKGLQTLSDESLGTSEPLSLVEYYGARRQFQAAVLRLRNKIKGIDKLPSLLATDPISVDDVEVPAFLRVTLGPIITFYEKQLTDLRQTAEKLSYLVGLPDSSIKRVTGLDYKISHPYTADDLAKMRKNAAQLRTMSGENLQILESYNRQILNRLTAFLNTFGTNQKLRKRQNVVERQKLLAREIEQAFWTRSYLRAVYGIRLGSVGIHYKKRVFDLDFFRNDNKLTFLSEFVRSEADLIQIKDQIFYALKTAESRSGLQQQSWVDRAANFTTFFQGEVQMSEVNTMILSLLAADIEEELLLGKAGGLRSMRETYRQRYYRTQESETRFKALAAQYIPDEENQEDLETDVAFIDAESLVGVFRLAQVALEGQYDRHYQAAAIEATIAEFSAQTSQRDKASKRRTI